MFKGIVIGIALTLTVAAATSQDRVSVVRARKFVLLDEKGADRAILGMSGNEAQLRIIGANQTHCVITSNTVTFTAGRAQTRLVMNDGVIVVSLIGGRESIEARVAKDTTSLEMRVPGKEPLRIRP